MKLPVWSYSFLSNYINCPRKAQAIYINKEVPYTESPEAAYGNQVHKDLELAVKNRKFVHEPIEAANKFLRDLYSLPCTDLIAEQQFGITREWEACDFFSPRVWGRGKLDVTALISRRVALLFDYKTGKVREDSFELEVQALLLKAKYPDLQIIKGCYIWLKEDKYGEVYNLSDRLDQTKKTIEEIMYKVGQGLFYTQKNPLCGWCSLRSCRYWHDHKISK